VHPRHVTLNLRCLLRRSSLLRTNSVSSTSGVPASVLGAPLSTVSQKLKVRLTCLGSMPECREHTVRRFDYDSLSHFIFCPSSLRIGF